MMIQVPRWRMVVETGHGWEDLTDAEKRLAWDYLCTDQTEAIVAQYVEVVAKLGRQASERIEAAVMESLNGN